MSQAKPNRVPFAEYLHGARVILTSPTTFAVTRPATPTPAKIATVSGRAFTYGDVSDDRGGYKVRLMPRSARYEANVRALWHHDWAEPLADTATGTFRIIPTAAGADFELDLPDTSRGRDALALIGSNIVRGMSIGMAAPPTYFETEEDGGVIANATDFILDEISVTVIPAFNMTSVALKPVITEPATTHARTPEKKSDAGGALAAQRRKVMVYRHQSYRP